MDIVLATFKLGGLLIHEGDKLTKEFNLTSARWKVLGAIYLSEKPQTVPDIARTMGLTRQAVQRLVDTLIEDKLLESYENPAHKKAKLFSLTAHGESTYSTLDAVQIEWAKSLSEDFNLNDLETTSHLLQNLIKTISR